MEVAKAAGGVCAMMVDDRFHFANETRGDRTSAPMKPRASKRSSGDPEPHLVAAVICATHHASRTNGPDQPFSATRDEQRILAPEKGNLGHEGGEKALRQGWPLRVLSGQADEDTIRSGRAAPMSAHCSARVTNPTPAL